MSRHGYCGNSLSVDRLRAIARYEPDTGEFFWIKCQYRKLIGKRCGWLRPGAYWELKIDGKIYSQHRLAWLYMTGSLPELDIDHIDCDRTNNRWNNLRAATPLMNSQNTRTGWGKSGFLGVRRQGKKWSAQIHYEGKRHHLGTFPDPESAHAVYLQAKRKHHEGCTI